MILSITTNLSTIVRFYMAFLHMWRKERQGKSGEVGSHARANLYYYMVEHWERHMYGGGQESGDSRRS